MFPDLMERTFQRRVSLNIPFLSRAFELTASCLADGLYSAGNLEAVVKDALGADKHILEPSYATSTGTRVGLPVATVSRHPSYRVFTNHNGVGTRDYEMGEFWKSNRPERSADSRKPGASSGPRVEPRKCRFGRCKRLPLFTSTLTSAPAPVL